MARKFRTFVPGGLQKSVTLPDGTSTQGTIIAGFQGQILSIDQLKTLLGLNNPNTQTPSGSTAGGSGTASITLGEGLAGGGPLLGTVRINPVSTGQGMFAEDAPDEQMMVPGPVGQRGQQGIPGPYGPPVYMVADDQPEEPLLVPGPPGAQGIQGPQGNPGTGGGAATPVWLPYESESPEEPVLMVGPRGAPGAQGPAGPAGISAPPVWIPDDTENNEPIYFGPAAAAASAGGSTGANPTAVVGLTAVNGSATTYTRSDGAPALSQAIAPTWTGTHIFEGAVSRSPSVSQVSIGTDGAYPSVNWSYNSGVLNQNIWEIYSSGSLLTLQMINDSITTGVVAMQFARSGMTITGISAYGPQQAGPVDITPDRGTFTATLTGMSATTTCIVNWSRVGNLVYLVFPQTTGTSNAATFTITGLPSYLLPSRAQNVVQYCINNGTGVTALFEFTASSGTITMAWMTTAVAWTGTWTASGAKGVAACMVPLMLN